MEFNFTGMTAAYREAYLRRDPTLVFEVRNGRGRFVFMVFFSEEDADAKDMLYLFLMNTVRILKLKMYGSHRGGDFKVHLDGGNAEDVVRELQLDARDGGGGPLDLRRMLAELNAAIPESVPLRDKIGTLRAIWPHVRHDLGHVVDEAHKTVLLGLKRLPKGKRPRAKTLRKLYLFTADSPDAIEHLIARLQAANRTLVWTTPDSGIRGETPADLFREF